MGYLRGVGSAARSRAPGKVLGVMGWKPMFEVGGGWYGNSLVFATEREALANGAAKFARWTVTTAYKAVETAEAPNYAWVEGALVPLPPIYVLPPATTEIVIAEAAAEEEVA